MNERAVVFGSSARLVGVVTESATQPEGSPGVLLLNAGLTHHIGPHRMYVDLARLLAADGLVTLRFDFSGVGDSGRRRDGLPAWQAVVPEARDAMDVLSEYGAREFALVGLCSGADAGFRIACADTRVVGVGFIDGFPYRTVGHRLRHYRRRLFRARSWANVLTGRHPFWSRFRPPRTDSEPAAPPPTLDDRDIPPRKEAAEGLTALVQRNVHLLALFSGGLPAFYSQREQFLRAFRDVTFGDRLRLEYFPDADHTFSVYASRLQLLSAVRSWMDTVARECRARGGPA